MTRPWLTRRARVGRALGHAAWWTQNVLTGRCQACGLRYGSHKFSCEAPR